MYFRSNFRMLNLNGHKMSIIIGFCYALFFRTPSSGCIMDNIYLITFAKSKCFVRLMTCLIGPAFSMEKPHMYLKTSDAKYNIRIYFYIWHSRNCLWEFVNCAGPLHKIRSHAPLYFLPFTYIQVLSSISAVNRNMGRCIPFHSALVPLRPHGSA